VTGENRPVQEITAVVTGASSGIGLAAAEELARLGARVVLVGRDPARLSAAVERVRAASGRSPQSYRADFLRLDEVRALAQKLAAAYPTIDLLANNAGGIVRRYTSTVDGYEATIQANHLAPFLLTNLLRDNLRGGRVVSTSSDAHRTGGIDPDDLVRKDHRYSLWLAYGASKQANILFAAEAARRWPDVLSTSYHPGVVRSRFGAGTIASVFYKVAPFLTTPAQGADTLVWLATAPADEITPGGYYYKRALRTPAPPARDPALAARLWEASAKAVGV
jgi:NAD(P)-dependent dehydrogenase (short-subunit alcohol dehydrogenase family)